jgi:putative oxidoreductase
MKQENFVSLGLLVLRLGVAGMMLAGHGWAKLIGFAGMVQHFPDPLGIGSRATLAVAVIAELVCSALLVLGLGTRVAAVPPLATMLVAAFMVSAHQPFAARELALLYATGYLTLLLAGGGRFALERVVKIQVKG